MTQRFYLKDLGIINALGSGSAEVARGLFAGDTSGMRLEDGWLPAGPARVGRARGELPEVPAAQSAYACRTTACCSPRWRRSPTVSTRC